MLHALFFCFCYCCAAMLPIFMQQRYKEKGYCNKDFFKKNMQNQSRLRQDTLHVSQTRNISGVKIRRLLLFAPLAHSQLQMPGVGNEHGPDGVPSANRAKTYGLTCYEDWTVSDLDDSRTNPKETLCPVKVNGRGRNEVRIITPKPIRRLR